MMREPNVDSMTKYSSALRTQLVVCRGAYMIHFIFAGR